LIEKSVKTAKKSVNLLKNEQYRLKVLIDSVLAIFRQTKKKQNGKADKKHEENEAEK